MRAMDEDLHVAEKATFTLPYFFKQILIMRRMWDRDVGQPLEWLAAVPWQPPSCARAPGQHGTHHLPAQQNAGRQCGRQGEVRRTLQHSLFSLLFFLIENAVWSQVKNNSPLSRPSFQGCSDVPGLQCQTRGSPAQRSLRGLSSSSQHRAHPDANKWGHSDSARAQGSGVGSLLW